MPQKTSKPTSAQGFDQAWKHFHAENYGLDVVPPGWISAVTYGKLNRVTAAAGANVLRTATQQGMAEAKKFRVMTSAGARVVAHYRLKS